ncbi:MAG: arginine--tRNA ligase [Coprothermobacterota bacterium]|nr:arginine--tRNA ligase [Coprothermobacterota bacterium]
MYYLQALGASLREALQHQFGGDAGPVSWEVAPASVQVTGRHGDLTCHYAFHAAKLFHTNPRELAHVLRAAIPPSLGVSTEVAGPGFLNFSLEAASAKAILSDVFQNPAGYGHWQQKQARQVNMEFCSANPTGPIHLGNARGACFGSVTANLLEACGHKVSREYYFDDFGTQVDTFALSLLARYREAQGQESVFPEGGYQGEYVREIGQRAAQEHFEWAGLPFQDLLVELRRFGLQEMARAHRQTMDGLGIHFDTWFSQSSLERDGFLHRAQVLLEDAGFLYPRDGALWFRSTAFGDDKDRVVIRSNGEPTYFAWDIAYNLHKRERGFDWIIDVWGPDHHGYVMRNKAAFQALGYDADDLTLLIYQLVRWFEQGEEVKMSKRTGEFLTLDEVTEAIGRDAVLFFLLNRSPDSTLDFNLDLARQQSLSNPVFYVQYAYTRAFSVEREAIQRGLAIGEIDLETCQAYGPAEHRLLAKIALAPEEIATAASNLLPHRLSGFAKELAGDFHSFYHDHRILGVDASLQQARLNLVSAFRITLGNILTLLGLSAPETM